MLKMTISTEDLGATRPVQVRLTTKVLYDLLMAVGSLPFDTHLADVSFTLVDSTCGGVEITTCKNARVSVATGEG